jgi:hypothetical protein
MGEMKREGIILFGNLKDRNFLKVQSVVERNI